MNIENKTELFRYERKFADSNADATEAELIIMTNPFCFLEIFHSRYINNIYFDTYDLDNYFDNQKGAPERCKVRIRWYGELFGKIDNPVLEFKIKKGYVGTKLRFKLKDFEFGDNLDFDPVYNAISESDLPDLIKYKLNNLQPALLNRYQRKYFLSFDGHYRITVDSGMEYHPLVFVRHPSTVYAQKQHKTVLELKYDVEYDANACKITQHIPFRISKNSKYVTGIERIY